MPISEIQSFGDNSHEKGESGLTIIGAGYGAFPGSAWMYQNINRTGFADQLLLTTWNDLIIGGVGIPLVPNNATGPVFLFVQHEDLIWSDGFAFTLTSSIVAGPLKHRAGLSCSAGRMLN